MTTEAVILTICSVIILAIFFAGDSSLLVTFEEATPRLAARVERNVATGTRFYKATDNGRTPNWTAPQQGGQ